jgi:hypothetical protein
MESNEVLVEALRRKFNSSISGRAHTLYSESFSGDGSEDTFTLTDSNYISFIDSVTVNSIELHKWRDYTIDDILPRTITFKPHAIPGTGTDNIVIAYGKGGVNWIYHDWTQESLKPSSYPRIACIRLPETRKDYIGYDSTSGKEHKYYNVPVQVTILAHEKGMITFDGVKKSPPEFITALSNQIKDFIEDFWRDVTYPELFHPTISRQGLRKPAGSDLYSEDITINFENIQT